MRTRAVLAGTAAVALAAAAPAVAAPKVEQLVVQKDGKARQAKVAAAKTQAHVGGRNCTVPSATPLAALLVSDVPKVKLHDYGSCSSKASDASGLFVRSIDGDANKGTDGWVYKVGHRLGTAGAADPSGPFGDGRLKDRARVTWFYCHLDAKDHSCQRTLDITVHPKGGGKFLVHVKRYDDRGHGKVAPGATVHAGARKAATDSNGDATLALAPGHHRIYADEPGAIRSFARGVDAA